MITYNQVILRPVTQAEYQEHWLGPELSAEDQVGNFDPSVYNWSWGADIAADPDKNRPNRHPGNKFDFAIVNKLDGVTVGFAGYYDYCTTSRHCELGLTINEQYRRNRFGYDAVRGLTRYLVNTMNTHRIQVHIYADNEASIGLFTRAGYTHEGMQREARFRNGRYQDVVQMSILDREL